MKRLIAFLLTLVMTVALFAVPGLAEESGSAFSEWNPEAPALKALTEYVEDVTNEASPNYIPPADRIATFDMDGTLMGELYPTYLEVMLLTERILKDPSYQPDEEMLEFGRMTRDHALDKSFPSDYDYQFSYHQAKAFAGMTLNEYADFITRFLVHEADGFEGMTYASAFYLPMVEVVEYLQDHGFKCFVVSGSDRFIVRTFIEGMLDIPYENIIGSDTALAARDQGDTDGIEYVFTGDDTLVRTDRLIIKDLKTNKVLQIAQEIGRQPVLSFGNSSGDVSMNNYALLNNRYRSAAFMLVADDEVRDYGNPAKHDELTEKWQGMGYQVISMRDDWKTIYGEEVKKTGEFHWLENYADGQAVSTGNTGKEGSRGKKVYFAARSVQLSKLKAFYEPEGNRPIPFAHAFYMATKEGGALFGNVGSLEPGYEFDALVIRDFSEPFRKLEPEESVERFCYTGGPGDILARYIRGESVTAGRS